MVTIVPVVEGDGDASAFPELLARILWEKYNRYDVSVALGKTKVVKANSRQKLENKLDNFLKHAQNKPGCEAILILVDADNDCPVTLAQRLTQRCDEIGTSCPVQIVCAHRTYESWFLASLNTVKGRHGIPDTAALSRDAEDVPNPKRWLSDQMPRGQAYKETTHQASLSRVIDLDLGPPEFPLLPPFVPCARATVGNRRYSANLITYPDLFRSTAPEPLVRRGSSASLP